MAQAFLGEVVKAAAGAVPREAVQPGVVVDATVPTTLGTLFGEAVSGVLCRRTPGCRVRISRGRDADEVLVVLTASGRRSPLPLYFPHAAELDADDVTRIVRNVLEGMGPGFA